MNINIKMNKNLYELDKLYKENKFNQVVKKTKELINSDNIIAPYYNLLGLSLSRLGKDQEAEIIFLEGIDKFPDEISLKSNISLTQINLNKYDEAQKNINKALNINNKDTFTLYALGHLKRVQLKYEEAIEIFKSICEKNVKFGRSLLLLGQSYLDLAQKNNLEKNYDFAKKNLLLCSELFPNLYGVDYTLSTIIDYSKNNFHQKKMLSKIEKQDLTNYEKYLLYFALGKSFEDQKKYNQSSEFIKIANKLKNETIIDNPLKKEKLKIRNIKNIFSKYSFSNFDQQNLFKKKIIFIVGLPRSGTTLVHQLISSSDSTFGFGESRFLNEFFENNIFNENFLSKLLNKKNSVQELIKISNEIGNKYNAISTKGVFIDKMPPNYYWIGFIKLIFPNSKIVHIKRNIKDNILSIYKNFFGTKIMDWSYDVDNIFNYWIYYNDVMKFWTKKYNNYIYDLSYENLVNNKEEETKKLFNFCQLEWNDKVFDFYKNAKTIRTVSINQVKKPIYQNSVNSSENFTRYFDFLNRFVDF